MKKLLISIFTVSLVFISISAFAWGHLGRDGERGCPCPKGSNFGEGGIGADINSFTAEDALATLENTLKPNYKDYAFGEV
jgi:hypothetical protein